jgi:hypothetical protein
LSNKYQGDPASSSISHSLSNASSFVDRCSMFCKQKRAGWQISVPNGGREADWLITACNGIIGGNCQLR